MVRKDEPLKIHGTFDEALRALVQPAAGKMVKRAKRKPVKKASKKK